MIVFTVRDIVGFVFFGLTALFFIGLIVWGAIVNSRGKK
jgi:hypothetical protein